MDILFIGLGGFLGALCRYWASGLAQRVIDRPWFPYGTLTVNLVGCLLIGFVMGLVETRQLMSPESRLFFVIGFLGSFTTFSTFSFETFELFQDGEFFFAIVNMVVSIIAGLFAVWLGYRLSSVI